MTASAALPPALRDAAHAAAPGMEGAGPVAVRPMARVVVSADLRDAYRHLGRIPLPRPARPSAVAPPSGPGAEGHAGSAPGGGHAPREETPGDAPGPEGGFPVWLNALSPTGRDAGAAPRPGAVAVAPLVTHPAPPGAEPGWALDLFVDRGGRAFARLTLALGPGGRSGRGVTAAALAGPGDLRALVAGALGAGGCAPTMPGSGSACPSLVDCLTPDGRLRPRPLH